MGKGSQFENAEIMVAVYNSESEAKATLDTLKQMEDQGTLDIIDAGTIEKKMDGKVHERFAEILDLAAQRMEVLMVGPPDPATLCCTSLSL